MDIGILNHALCAVDGEMKKYQVIYADPPWHFKTYQDAWQTNNADRSRWVGNKYPLMSFDEIRKLPICKIADENAILFLWTTPVFINRAFSIIEAWGFKYKTVGFTWAKVSNGGRPAFGMGYWTRQNAEFCLLATKGKPKRMSASVQSLVLHPRLKHSQKPDEVRRRSDIQLMETP